MSTLLRGRSVEVHEDIRGIAPAEWDVLLDADDLQATHRFVRACQASEIEHAQYRHVLGRDDDGIAFIASFCAFPGRLELLAPRGVRSTVTTLRRVAPGFAQPTLVIGGLPVSFNQSCLRIRPDTPVDSVLPYLEAVVEELAGTTGASIVCLKEFDDADSERLAPISRFGYAHAWSLPTFTLPIRWQSFGDYLASLRSSYRHQILATLNRARNAGLIVRLERRNTRAACELLFPLYSQVMDRADYQLERLSAQFFEQLSCLHETEVLLVEQAGKVVAGAILLRGQKRGTFLIAGIDYEHNRECHAYITLVTHVVQWAIEAGFSEVELGQTSYHLKMRFGAVPRGRHLFFRHRGPLGSKLLPPLLPVLFPRHSYAPRRAFHIA